MKPLYLLLLLLLLAGRSLAQSPQLPKETAVAYKKQLDRIRHRYDNDANRTQDDYQKWSVRQELDAVAQPGQPARLPVLLPAQRACELLVYCSGPARVRLHPDPRNISSISDEGAPDSVRLPGGSPAFEQAPFSGYGFEAIKQATDRTTQVVVEADAPTLVHVAVFERKFKRWELARYDPKKRAEAEKQATAASAQRTRDQAAQNTKAAQAAGLTLVPGQVLTPEQEAAIRRERQKPTKLQVSCTLSDKNQRDKPETVESIYRYAFHVPHAETGELVCLRRASTDNASQQTLSFTAEAGYHYLFAYTTGYLKGGPNGLKMPDQLYVGVRDAAGNYLASQEGGFNSTSAECNYAFQADTPITVVYK